MLTRMSTLFLRTLREDPADAEVPSHRLLVRAGYVRRVAPGIFSWLPLGYQVLRNVERIVREEMDGAGFQEVHFPALLPREPYERTNRWTEYGPNLFRLADRRGSDSLLAPAWGPAREVRDTQYLMATDAPAREPAHPCGTPGNGPFAPVAAWQDGRRARRAQGADHAPPP